MKRQRGRGRKPGGGGGHHHNNNHHGGGGNQPNRTLESNGPDIKVRGPAAHIYERYLQLGRDASSSGDRVTAENYLQHAEHYFRMLRAMQPAAPPPQMQQDRYGDQDYEGDDEGGDNEAAETEMAAEGGDQAQGDFAGGQQNQNGGFDRDGEGGARRRGRGRRTRFRPDGEREGGGEGGEGGERPQGEQRAERQDRPERQERADRPERQERQDRPERRERAPRDSAPREGGEGAEGFSSGPKPAFLRSD